MGTFALVHALHDIWNTGDLARIDEVYHQGYVAHWPAASEMPERRGLQGVRFGVERIRAAFPDWHEKIEDLFGEDDKICARYVSTGTHEGAFWGVPPTGRRIHLEEVSIYRVLEGRIVEQWCFFDELTRLKQIGVTEARLRELLCA